MERKIPWTEFVKLRKIPRRPKRRLRTGHIEISLPVIPAIVANSSGTAKVTPTAPPLNEESDCGSWGSDFDDNNSNEEDIMDHTEEIEQNRINTYLEIIRNSQRELGDPETTSGSNPLLDQKISFFSNLFNKCGNSISTHDLIAKLQPFLLTDVNYVPADNGSRPTPNFQPGASSEVTENVTTSPQNFPNIPSPSQVENGTDPLGANSNCVSKVIASSSSSSTHSKVPEQLVKSPVVSSPTHSGAAVNVPPPLPSRPPPVSNAMKRSVARSLEEKLNLTRKPQSILTSGSKLSSVQTAPTPDVRVQPCTEPTLEKQPPPLPKSKPGLLRKPKTPGGFPSQQQKPFFTTVNSQLGKEEIGVPGEVKKTIDIKSLYPRSENIAKVEATKENSSDPKHVTVSQNQSDDPRDWLKLERPTLPTKQKPMRKALSLSSIVEAVEKMTSDKKGKKWKTYNIDNLSEGNQEATAEIPKNKGMLDLSSQTWYHPITWPKANRKLLEMDQDGAFLVRPRMSFHEGVPYTISFSSGGRILNCHIVMTKNGKYALGKTHFHAKEFDTLSELICFHQKTPALLKVEDNKEPFFVRFLITPEKDEEEA